jgi:hypothetical protein
MSDDPSMSDYRNQDFNHLSAEDPFRSSAKMDPDTGAANVAWGWVAAAVFLVVILAVAFGIGHQPGGIGTNTASNDIAPPAVTHMAPPPASVLPPVTITPPPITPAPNMPVPHGGTQ